jgi:predicted O-methyltransferase YrrM
MAYSTTPKIMNPTTGWASSDQLALIEEWAKEVPKNGIVVEVGAFVGRSAWHWAKSVDPSVTVYAIDSWDPTLYSKYRERRHLLEGTRLDPKTVECTFDDFSKNTYDCPNLIGVKARSPNIPSVILDKLHNVDLIYLDDSHVNPEFKNNVEFWIKRLKPKGIFCGDDFLAGHVPTTVSHFAFLNKKQLYARSNFWRMYDWDETITN